MLFQGQEYASSSPFFYFADHEDEISRRIAKGRADFLAQFGSLATPEMQARLPDPGNPMSFVTSKLKPGERFSHAAEYALCRDLLRLRREDPVFRSARRSGRTDGAVLGTDAFLLRFFGEKERDTRLVLVNLGRDLLISPAPEPLLAPPEKSEWALLWSSEAPLYGGTGTPRWPTAGGWRLAGETVVVLHPEEGDS